MNIHYWIREGIVLGILGFMIYILIKLTFGRKILETMINREILKIFLERG